jgi:hypothetical protein
MRLSTLPEVCGLKTLVAWSLGVARARGEVGLGAGMDGAGAKAKFALAVGRGAGHGFMLKMAIGSYAAKTSSY